MTPYFYKCTFYLNAPYFQHGPRQIPAISDVECNHHPTLTHTYTGRPIYVTVECESYVFKPECFLKLCAKNDNYTLIIIICLNLRCLPDLTRLNRLNLAKHHDTDGKAERSTRADDLGQGRSKV